jgi:hypothetical protein
VRRVWVGICVTVIVVASGCGGGEMSLSEYVDAALGCESFPENPEAVYRQPPATSTP